MTTTMTAPTADLNAHSTDCAPPLCETPKKPHPWSIHYYKNPPEEAKFKSMFLQEILDAAAKNFGKNNAITFENYRLDYHNLLILAERFAASLKDLGIEKGDRIAIMLPNIPQTVIAFWGCIKAGAIVVMTNPMYMEKELTHHFNDSKPKILITLDLFWEKIQNLNHAFNIEHYIVTTVSQGLSFPLNMLQRLKAIKSKAAPNIEYSSTVLSWKKMLKHNKRYAESTDGRPEDHVAILQYTGGTTGVSKAAMLSHANLTIQLEQLKTILHTDRYDHQHLFLSLMPFFHIFGLVGCILLPASFRSGTLPVPRYVPADLLHVIKKYRPTFFNGAPSIYISLLQQKKINQVDLSCIEFCISGSAPFPTASMKRFQELTKANITEGFGLTEASPVVAANPVFGLQKPGSVGVALPATQIKIVDANDPNIELPADEVGEILIKGPQVMLGYWNQPLETENVLRNGWLHTGDLGYLDNDNYCFVVDRKKDMAIIAGYNVFPTEIDEVLYSHPKVQEAISLSIPHRSKGEMLKAYIVPKEGEELSTKEIITYCKEKLAPYKVPKAIEFRTELPKSSVGKILRRVLRDEEVNTQ